MEFLSLEAIGGPYDGKLIRIKPGTKTVHLPCWHGETTFRASYEVHGQKAMFLTLDKPEVSFHNLNITTQRKIA